MGRPRGPLPKAQPSRDRDEKRRTYEQTVLGRAPAKVDDAPTFSVRKWKALHVESRAYWTMLLEAPQASEYLPSDWRRLKMVILPIVERLNRAVEREDDAAIVKLAAELRQQEADFGLTPSSRLRMRWTVHRAGQTSPENEPEENPEAKPKRRRKAGDPRLAVVK